MAREELLARVEALIGETQGVAFVVPEDTGHFSIDDDMVKGVRRLISDAIGLLRDITDAYDAESAAHGEGDEGEEDAGEFLKEIGAQISSELAAREVSGLAFVENLFAQHLVHKTVLSLIALVLFGVLLAGRQFAGWRGRRAVFLYLWGFVVLGLAYFGSRYILEALLGRSWG